MSTDEEAAAVPVDAALEHRRALARARQQRKRWRDKARVTSDAIVTDSNGHASVRLTRLAHGLAAGLTENDALRAIGASVNSRHLTKMDSVQAAVREILAKQRISVARVAESINKRLDATSPMLTATGSIERPDWPAQASGCRDAIALLDRSGDLPQPNVTGGGNQITVVIQTYNLSQSGSDNSDIHKPITLNVENV